MPASPRDKPGTILILQGGGAPRSRREQLLTEVAAVKSRIPVSVTHIQRMSLPYEQISCGVDFSVGRIEALIEQGEQDARQAVA
jgi:hypothetical protein